MTVIYVETHLTADPYYNEQDRMVCFTVAMSKFTVECHIHREEIIRYMHDHAIRTGDIVQIYGVFMCIAHPDSGESACIKISSLMLPSVIGTTRKKRKIDDVQAIAYSANTNNVTAAWVENETRRIAASIDEPRQKSRPMSISETQEQQSPSFSTFIAKLKDATASAGIYKEWTGSFSDYYFLLLGQVNFIKQFANDSIIEKINEYQRSGQPSSAAEEIKELQRKHDANSEFLEGLLFQLYATQTEHLISGKAKKIYVVNFVNTATSLIEKIDSIKRGLDMSLPLGLQIEFKVSLPTSVYNSFMNDE